MTTIARQLSIIAASTTIALVAQAQEVVPTVTKKLTIGCESCGDARQFGTIWDVSVASNGDILVTDRDMPMLRRFDATGKVTWSGGRKGKGPGEYTMPVRSALVANGIAVVDMANTRLTELGADGSLIGSVPVMSLATASGANARGDVIVGLDDFGRTFKVLIRQGSGTLELRPLASFPGSMKNKSLAMAPDGSIAVALDGEKYEIARLNAAGKVIDTIARDIPRPRRSAVEEAEYRKRLDRDLGMMAAEMKKSGMSGKISAPVVPPEERGLKSHVNTDGLRFDGAGRLWVHTMRGDETKTVFDVFSTAGSLLGSVTIPMRVNGFWLAGPWLVTGAENEDGLPIVVLWTVK